MHAFTFLRVSDAQSAIAAHGTDPNVAFIAGGTDLVGLMKDRATLPGRLLDINALPALAAIEAGSDGGLHIGALARMSDVAAHPAVRRHFPVVAEFCFSRVRGSYAIWPRSAATSYNVLGVLTSEMATVFPVTSERLGLVAPRCTDSTAATRSSVGRSHAWLNASVGLRRSADSTGRNRTCELYTAIA